MYALHTMSENDEQDVILSGLTETEKIDVNRHAFCRRFSQGVRRGEGGTGVA